MSEVENMAGEEELQHEEARQQECVHNHPAQPATEADLLLNHPAWNNGYRLPISVAVLRIRDPGSGAFLTP